MIDSKFSQSNFKETAGTLAVDLSSELEGIVLQRLNGVIEKEFQRIVHELNEVGHSLSVREGSAVGDIGYIEKEGLRLNVDVVVSSGYDDLIE